MSGQYRSLKNVVYVNGHILHFFNGFNDFSFLLYQGISTEATNSSCKVLFYAVYVDVACLQISRTFFQAAIFGKRFFI